MATFETHGRSQDYPDFRLGDMYSWGRGIASDGGAPGIRAGVMERVAQRRMLFLRIRTEREILKGWRSHFWAWCCWMITRLW